MLKAMVNDRRHKLMNACLEHSRSYFIQSIPPTPIPPPPAPAHSHLPGDFRGTRGGEQAVGTLACGEGTNERKVRVDRMDER